MIPHFKKHANVPGEDADAIDQSPDSAHQGKVIPVIGFMGASGRTTTAKELAAQLAHVGSTPCLVDADLQSPTLTKELHAQTDCDLVDGLRAMEHDIGDWPGRVFNHVGNSELRLISGLRQAHRWLDILPQPFLSLVAEAHNRYSHTVLDICGGFESLSTPTASSVPSRFRDPRQLAHLTLLNSDCAIVTTRPDDISLARLVDAMKRRQHHFAEKKLHVVVTQVINSREEREAKNTVKNLLGVHSVICIPQDSQITRRAISDGRFASDIQPQTEFVQAYKELAEIILTNKESTLATTRMTSVLRRVS